MCCRDWLQGLWVQLLPRLSCGSQACRGISRCPNQIFSGPLARASLYLTKVVSALIPMAILLPPSQTARPRPSLHRDGHAREGLVSYHSMQNNPPHNTADILPFTRAILRTPYSQPQESCLPQRPSTHRTSPSARLVLLGL